MQKRLEIVESELHKQQTKMAADTNTDVTIPHPPTERRTYSEHLLEAGGSTGAGRSNSRSILEILKTQDRQQEQV